MSNNPTSTGLIDPSLTCERAGPSRRQILAGTAAGAAWAMMPATALSSTASSKDPRLLVIILRGALDGLAAVPPLGDPDYQDLRAGFNLTQDTVLPLDGFFALNANMPNLARLYRQGDAAIVHAAATSYRSRSHFDGQDILESGFPGIGGKSGWLNRATGQLASSSRARPAAAVSLGHTAPLIMQGESPVMTWAPQFYPQPDRDTLNRIMQLYNANDPVLGDLLQAGIELDETDGGERLKLGSANKLFLREIDQTIRFFADPDGPRIAALSSNGWDTHATQNPVKGNLANRLAGLDRGIGKLKEGLGSIWPETAIVIATEFGRTVAINGTRGTDHGTGACMFLLGGAIKGGRVLADWPGLGSRNLHQKRDLMPTIHVNGVFKGLLRDHFGLDRRKLDHVVFPDSRDTPAFDGLLA